MKSMRDWPNLIAPRSGCCCRRFPAVWIGNGIGGAFFVAALKYGHSSRGADDENGPKVQESPTGGKNLGSAS